MKQILPFCLALSFTTNSLAQYADTSTHIMATDYLKKSKSQKTAAWVLLGGGFALSTTGALISTRKVAEDLAGVVTGAFGYPEPQNNYTGETILLVGGVVAMLSSIPLFIAASKNRKKAAASVSFKMENATNIYQCAFTNTLYPAVAIQIRL